jgi:hypothetical protein
VISRKLPFGPQARQGNRLPKTLLTIAETCRQRYRTAFAFIADAIRHTFARLLTPAIYRV